MKTVWAVLVAALAAVLASGCASHDDRASQAGGSTPTVAERAALRPISMPDLSGAADALRTQLQDRYAALKATVDNSQTTTGELATAFGEMGKFLMAAEYFDAAEACLLNANALAPDDPRWSYYLAQVYRNQNEFAKAAAFFDRTLQLRPDDAPALLWAGEMRLAQGQPVNAMPLFSKALAQESRSAAANFGLGRAELASKDYVNAVQHFERTLELDPRASVVHYPLALAYRGLGDRAKTEAHLQQRGDARVEFPADPLMHDIDELPVNAMAFELRGNEAVRKGELAAAADYFRKASALDPRNPALHLRLADALRRTGSPEESLAHYDAALALEPREAPAQFGYAMALVRLGRFQDARNRLADGMKKYPDQSGFAEALARLLAAAPDDRVRDGRQALALAQTLLKDRQSVDLGETLAMAFAELHEYSEAARVQRELITAAKKAGRDDLAPRLADNLERYERREACRIPWPPDAMP